MLMATNAFISAASVAFQRGSEVASLVPAAGGAFAAALSFVEIANFSKKSAPNICSKNLIG